MDSAFELLESPPRPLGSRRFPRKPVLFARVLFGPEANDAGIVLNLSEGGLCAQTVKEITSDSPLQLRLPCLPSGWVELTGRSVWHDETQKITGIEFVDLAEETRHEIRKWLSFGTSLQELRQTWTDKGPESRARLTDSVAKSEPAGKETAPSVLGDPVGKAEPVESTPDAAVHSERPLGKQLTDSGRGSRNLPAAALGIAVVLVGLVAIWNTRPGHLAQPVGQSSRAQTVEGNKNPAAPPSSAPKELPSAPPHELAVDNSSTSKSSPPSSAPATSVNTQTRVASQAGAISSQKNAERSAKPAQGLAAASSSTSKSSPPSSAPADSVNPQSGVSLQVGAMSSQENAEKLAESLRQKNFSVSVLRRPNERFYKVLVGPYNDNTSLANAKDALTSEGLKTIEKHWSAEDK
jgi:cell division septation protein DedD